MKKKSLKKLKVLAGALVYLMVVTGCGSSDSAKMAESPAYAEDSYVTESAEAGGIYNDAYDAEEYADESTATTESETITEDKAAKSKRKLITNMSMITETKEFDKTVDFLQKRTENLGGYVESFSTSKSSYSDERSAYLTLRVPEEKLSGFVSEVAEKSNITSQDMNVTDVTLTYADLESHKNALRAEEEQLLALMEKAESIEDIMAIQDKLTDVRYQLESMESQLRTYDNQISFSTLKVTVEEVIDYTPEPVKNPTFWERAKEGFLDNCKNVATFFTELLLFIITHIITIAILAAIVVIIIMMIRKHEKKRIERMKNAPKKAPSPLPGNGAYTYGPAQVNNRNAADGNASGETASKDAAKSDEKSPENKD